MEPPIYSYIFFLFLDQCFINTKTWRSNGSRFGIIQLFDVEFSHTSRDAVLIEEIIKVVPISLLWF